MYALVCKYRIFSEELSGQRLKEYFIKSILEWSHASLEMENFTVLEFLDSLNCGWFWFFVMAVFCRYLLVFLVLLLCNTAYIHRVHSLFLALCINRCSVLSYKKKKKDFSIWGVTGKCSCQSDHRLHHIVDLSRLVGCSFAWKPRSADLEAISLGNMGAFLLLSLLRF